MRTNQLSGGVSSRAERSQGRRQKRLCSGAAPRFLRSRPAVVVTAKLRRDRRPGRLPLRVRDAAAAPIGAGGDRRLPELDRVEVGTRCVSVVLRARAGLKGLHLLARHRVDRSLAEEQSLLRLHLRRAHVRGPEVRAVGVRGVGREHPCVAPSGRALARDGVGDGYFAIGLELDGLVRPRGPDDDVAILEQRDLIAGRAQYFLIKGLCCFSKATDASNCLCVSSYGSLIPRLGCVFMRYSAASAIWMGLSGTVTRPLLAGS